MAELPYFFKAPDVPKLRAIVTFYEQGKLAKVLPERDEMESWSDELNEAMAEKLGEFIRPVAKP